VERVLNDNHQTNFLIFFSQTDRHTGTPVEVPPVQTMNKYWNDSEWYFIGPKSNGLYNTIQ
jgi:hypothetical protein